MTLCKECGSEAADNDLFCPFCGIALQAAPIAAAPEDPFASTIAISSKEAATAMESIGAKDPVDTVEPTPVAPAEIPVDVDSAGNVAVSERTETEENAVSEPAMPQSSSEEDNVPAEPVSVDKEVPSEQPQIAKMAEEGMIPEAAEITSEIVEDAPGSPDPDIALPTGITEPEASSGDIAIEDIPEPSEPNIAESTSDEPAIVEDSPPKRFDQSLEAPLFGDEYYEKDEVQSSAEEIPVIETPSVPEHTSDPNEGLFAAALGDLPASPAIIVEEAVNTGDISDSDADEMLAAPAIETPSDPIPVDAGSGDAGSQTSSVTGGTGGKKAALKVLTEGTVLNNRYEILKKIGGGGMGAVYLSNDRNLGGVQRAVKEMVQAHIEDAQQEKAIDDFRRESMILSSLDHPSIPTIYDYFFDGDEGRFYLVMKYISGGDLAGRLRAAPEGRIDELTVAEWGFQIADVLSYLHNLPQRIVYRDLKPSNVMLDGSTGKVMLIDFGIARSVNQVDEKGVTAVGTMGYAPPELFSGNVEPRSDIYSLGSTMFHLMTGADPQNNPLLIFDFDKNPRPRQINPRLSDQIEKVLMRCVEYNADRRFSNAAELRDALGSHADNLRAGRVTYGVSEAPAAVALSDQPVFCGFCGQRIVAADMFCAFCGAKQPLAQHNVGNVPVPGSMRLAQTTARLIVDGTTELDAPVYVIEKQDNLVGRRDPQSNIFPEVDLSKFDPQTKISRRHARILQDGANYLVEDLGSSNGTVLLSDVSSSLRLLPHQPHRLNNGDRIRVGDTTLHFLVG